MKTQIFIFLFLLIAAGGNAQTSLYGKVTDAPTGEPILFGTVTLHKNGNLITGTETDFDGNYNLANIDPGSYDVSFAYVGYPTVVYNGVRVLADQANILNAEMEPGGVLLDEVVVKSYKVPLIQQDNTTQGATITSSRLRNLPKKNIRSQPAGTAGVRSTGNNQQKPAAKPAVKEKPTKNSPAAGQLTAGHWRDMDNKDYWKDILDEDLNEWKSHWQMYPTDVIELELVNENDLPLIDAVVRFYTADNRELLWSARTDNRGKAALWTKPFNERSKKIKVTAEVQHAGKIYPLNLKSKTGKQQTKFKIETECRVAPVIDMLFAIDVSGSMKDELSFLQSELTDVIDRVRTAQNKTVRTASVCYQSPGDAYLTKASDFTEDAEITSAFFGMQEAKGGKGGPEAVEAGLAHALKLNWSPNAAARLLFILLDEPPGHDAERRLQLQNITRQAAERGIKIIPVVGSGAKRDLEFLLRSLAVMTNGTYVFLTDHSGIGDAHLEPVTDSYEVFALNDLLVKIVADHADYESCETKEATDISDTYVFDFEVFPNPVSEVLTVKLPKENMTARLFDLHGKLLLTLDAENLTADVSNFPPGNYFLEVTDNKQVQTAVIAVVR